MLERGVTVKEVKRSIFFSPEKSVSFALLPSTGSSVGSEASCQSRGCEFEFHLGQHFFRRFTKVTVTSVILLSQMGLQSMWRSSLLLGKNVVWSTGVINPGNT